MIYKWRCTICQYETDVEHPIAECTTPPADSCPPWDSRPEEEQQESPMKWEEVHAPEWQRVFEAPMHMQASFPDGTKRKGWDQMREAAKIEKEALKQPQNKRTEFAAEIKKLGVKSNLISTGGKK